VPRESATAANQMDTIHASCFQGILRASDAGSTVDGKPSGASGSIQARLVQMSGATSLPGSVLWQFACARSHTHTNTHMCGKAFRLCCGKPHTITVSWQPWEDLCPFL